jgi:hypothetical protein
MKLVRAALLLTLAAAAWAQVNVGEQKPEAGLPFNVTTVASFKLPWRLAFLPDGRMLITEKVGPVWLVTQKGEKIQIENTPPVFYQGQNGMMGVFLSPKYATDKKIYLTYVAPGEYGGGYTMARATLNATATSAKLDNFEVLWQQLPTGRGGQAGGPIAFSADGQYLFLAVGDRQRMTPAQDPNQPVGKILRLTLDGKPAPGNPNAGKTGASTIPLIDPPRDTEAAKTAPVRWFNDVWMKEVLANFMAVKIVNPSFPQLNHDLRFLLTHYPAAYEVDRTAGSNPIRQELANLNEAGSLYGAIIYNKAPIAMRQLETIAGESGFRDGMREYLKKFSFGNATWLDLVSILEARNPAQAAPWSKAWVEQRGRPEISVQVSDGRVRLTQRDPLRRGLLWPQRLMVSVAGERREVSIAGKTAEIAVKGRPSYVLPNAGGLGYGLFRLDPATRRYLLAHVEELPDALDRGSAWVALYEEMVEGDVKGTEFLDAAARAVERESDEQNTQRILSYLTRTFWQELGAAQRRERAPGLEALLRSGMAKAPSASRKSAWFSAFRETALTRDGLVWLERVWRREEKVEGLTFAETDEIDMAMNLAVREVPGWEKILEAQLARTQNPDRKARFAFVMPALAADPAVREQSFARFLDGKNRSHEPWVLEAMRYLNHPLREGHARRFVRPALELLPEIQRTGDIFFPKRWLDATLGGHRSPEAAATVREYLSRHPELPERLRWVVLSAGDDLFRTAARRL